MLFYIKNGIIRPIQGIKVLIHPEFIKQQWNSGLKEITCNSENEMVHDIVIINWLLLPREF